MRKKNSSIKRKTLQKKNKIRQIKKYFIDENKLIQKKTRRESELSTNSESNLTIKNKSKIPIKKIKEKWNGENIKECPICNWRFPNIIIIENIIKLIVNNVMNMRIVLFVIKYFILFLKK